MTVIIVLKMKLFYFNNAVMYPKDADGMANCVDPNRS